MGIAVHDSIMEWERSERQLDIIPYYLERYDVLVFEAKQDQPDYAYWYLPPNAKYVDKSIASYRERGEDQLRGYIDEFEYAPWEIGYLEKPFEIDLDGITIKGAVDRILFFPADDYYLVEDLKTGTLKDEADFRQLGFYAFVARELWDVPVRHGRYWYTKVNRASPEYDVAFMDREFWTRQFHRLDKAIQQGIYLPSPGAQCGLCPVKPWCSTQGHLEIGESL